MIYQHRVEFVAGNLNKVIEMLDHSSIDGWNCFHISEGRKHLPGYRTDIPDYSELNTPFIVFGHNLWLRKVVINEGDAHGP